MILSNDMVVLKEDSILGHELVIYKVNDPGFIAFSTLDIKFFSDLYLYMEICSTWDELFSTE